MFSRKILAFFGFCSAGLFKNQAQSDGNPFVYKRQMNNDVMDIGTNVFGEEFGNLTTVLMP